jgi:Holliday junction DNA helicase RuvA
VIASIRGEVLAHGPGWVVVGVGGVGIRIEIPVRLAVLHPGADLALHTHLVVREDSLTLYGFDTSDELEVFAILLNVSGVGPKSALGVLSALTPSQIAVAAANEDEKPFRKVSGIGPKTAKLIAVQLAGKLDPRAFVDAAVESPATTPVGASGVAALVAQGLIGLGYSEQLAEQAVSDAEAAGAASDESSLLRAALALLQAPRSRNSALSSDGSRT